MTAAAEFILIHVVHFHTRTAFSIFEYGGVAVLAFEHGGMDLMTENRRRHVAGRINEILFQNRHGVASGAVLCGKSRFTIVTFAAGIPFIHIFHDESGGAAFHLEKPRMAFAAIVFFSMILVREIHRHSRTRI